MVENPSGLKPSTEPKLTTKQLTSANAATKIESPDRHEQKFQKAVTKFNQYSKSGVNTSIKKDLSASESRKVSPEPHKVRDYIMSTSKSMGFEMSGLKDQDIAGELGEARRKYFERTFGKKIEATLIGEDDLDHLN